MSLPAPRSLQVRTLETQPLNPKSQTMTWRKFQPVVFPTHEVLPYKVSVLPLPTRVATSPARSMRMHRPSSPASTPAPGSIALVIPTTRSSSSRSCDVPRSSSSVSNRNRQPEKNEMTDERQTFSDRILPCLQIIAITPCPSPWSGKVITFLKESSTPFASFLSNLRLGGVCRRRRAPRLACGTARLSPSSTQLRRRLPRRTGFGSQAGMSTLLRKR